MPRQVVLKKTAGIFQVAPGFPEELVMGIAHIADQVFFVHA